MINIIKTVTKNRMDQDPTQDKTIKLSSVFMKHLIDEINKTLPIEKQMINDNWGAELYLNINDQEWTIINKSYRDDSSDEDIEEEMAKKLRSL